jgi:hypothetical protein
MEYWKAVILESFPLHIVIPMIIIGAFLFFGGSFAYDVWMEGREVVVDVVDTVSHNEWLGWEEESATPISTGIRHMVGLESNRVSLD